MSNGLLGRWDRVKVSSKLFLSAASLVRKKSMEITVLGGYGVGKTMYLERHPEAGGTVTGGKYREGPGGKASNQAIQILRLGVAANLITAVGTDSGAELGRDLWLTEGVNRDGVVVLDAPTMVGFISVDSDGDNRIAIAPGALAHMTVADLESLYPVIDRSAALVVSFELNPLVGFEAIRHARQAGITTVCNPAPATEIPADVLSCIDYLVPNLFEAAQIVQALGAGVKYLKNASSGAIETANPESISFLVSHCPSGVGVKASGGITTFNQTAALLGAGAQMVGTSAGISIVSGNSALGAGSY
jgi:bifunctional ADP-heptose synthase (sugar kinase/adenylyltransferase)